jgi:hypothetical protein
MMATSGQQQETGWRIVNIMPQTSCLLQDTAQAVPSAARLTS